MDIGQTHPLGGMFSTRGADFVQMFKRGDIDTLASVYRNFKLPIWNYVFGKVHDRETAEEITQEVFIKIIRSKNLYDPKFAFSTWLWTIAKNTTLDWYRKNRFNLVPKAGSEQAEGSDGIIDQLPSNDRGPEENLSRKLKRLALRKILTPLTLKQRQVMILRLVENLSYREISERLHLNIPAIKSLVFRARSLMQNSVIQYETI